MEYYIIICHLFYLISWFIGLGIGHYSPFIIKFPISLPFVRTMTFIYRLFQYSSTNSSSCNGTTALIWVDSFFPATFASSSTKHSSTSFTTAPANFRKLYSSDHITHPHGSNYRVRPHYALWVEEKRKSWSAANLTRDQIPHCLHWDGEILLWWLGWYW